MEVSKRHRVLNRNFARSWCFGANNGDNDGDSSNNASNDSNLATTTSRDEAEERAQSSDDFDSDESKASISSRKTLIKKKLFGYSTLWVTKEEPFGDLGEGILFLGNLRGKREEVFPNFRVSWLNSWATSTIYLWWRNPILKDQTRSGPRVSFGMLGKEVSEPGPTTLWQYVIALLLFVLTIGSSVELGIASQINRLPPEVVKYFTDPNAIEPPDMQLLFPFEVGHFFAAFPKKVKLSIPFFIPNITLGSFGAITQFKSILLDQKTKVDISLAVAGATLSFSMFAVGLLLSSNPNATGDLVQVPSMLFQGSLLLGLISRATLGYA
ncbi:unnamed protein product [Camellia sinensis]